MAPFYRFLPLLITTPVLAQTTLTGRVQATNGQGLPYANVLLLNATDSVLIKGAVATETGAFILGGLQAGRYLLATTAVGYRTAYSAPFPLTSADGVQTVAPLVVLPAEKQLEEVTVTARKPPFEQQPDRMVVNVASMITAAGGSVLDVLERSPGVRVDRQNGDIALSGRQGVMVMINGKLSRLPLETLVQLLSGMNADNVEKIELITNPPAKYDAEGNAGLINIVLKRKQDEGTNGNFALMAGYGKYEKANGSLTLNHSRGRISTFANASTNYDNRWFDFLATRTQPVSGELWRNVQYSDRYTKNYNSDFRLGGDLSLSKQTTLSGQVQGLSNSRRATSYNTSATRALPAAQPFTESVLTWLETNPWNNLGGSLGLLHRFNDGHSLALDADYQYYTNDSSNDLIVNQFFSQNPQSTPVRAVNTTKETTIRFWVFRADYTRSLGKGWKLETGAKLNRSDINNALGVQRQIDNHFVTDPDLTSTALFTETIGAAYGNLSGKLGRKTDVQAGLRVESTQTHIEDANARPLLNRQYVNLFPSASLSHPLNPQQTVSLSYSRRITRPNYSDLTPNFFLTDPTTFYVGNINLKPAYTSTIRAGYAYKSQYFLNLGYSREHNPIFRHQPVTRPGRPELIHTVQNFDQVAIWSAELTLPITFTSWWTVQNNLSGFVRTERTQFETTPFYRRIAYSTVNSVHSFRLGNGWSSELSVLYRSFTPFGVMYLRAMTNVVLGVQKTLPHDRGRFRLTMNDLLWTNQLRWYAYVPEQQLEFAATLRDAPRIVKLTYSRSFGSQVIKTVRQNRAADDEKKRVSF